MKEIVKRYNDFLTELENVENCISKLNGVFSLNINELNEYSEKLLELIKKLDLINKDFNEFYLRPDTANEHKQVCQTNLDFVKDKYNRITNVYLLPINKRISDFNSDDSKKREKNYFWWGVILGLIFSILPQVMYDLLKSNYINSNEIDKQYFDTKIDSLIDIKKTLYLDSISLKNKTLVYLTDSLTKEINILKIQNPRKVIKNNESKDSK